MSHTWITFGCCVSLAGCLSGPASPERETHDRPDVPGIFREVARIRQLPRQELPEVKFLPRDDYLEAVDPPSFAPSKRALELEQALGMLPNGSNVRIERERALTSVGLFDRRTQTVYVLDDPTRPFSLAEENVLAHECVHALQDENGLMNMPAPKWSDGLLARHALFEGDAMVAELLYDERNWHTPTRRVAERIMRGFATEPISRQVTVTNPTFAQASPVQKETLLFPYRGGAAFVGELLSTGGYELVAKAYLAPPVSTAQILHPDRYAQGELPISIPEPTLPAGFVAGRSDVLGELTTRSLLLRCNDAADAIQAAEGWRGDRAVSFRNGEHIVTAQQWVLDTEQDARELSAAVAKTCPGAPLTGVVMKKGTRVVAVRGGAESISESLAREWLGVPLTVPEAARPLGNVELKPIAAVPEQSPFEQDEWLQYPAAGVELRIPPGFDWSSNGGVELADSGRDAVTGLHITLSEYFPAATEQILLGLSRAMATAVTYSDVVRVGDPYAVKTVLGSAMAQDFQHEVTRYGGRVLAVPLCHSQIMLSVVQTWADTSSRKKLEWAVENMQEIPESDFCERLTH